MSKKVIISESMLKRIVSEEIIKEGELTKTDVTNIVKDTLKNDKQLKKETEKMVRSLVASSVNTLFRTLWQRRNFYEDEIKRG